MENKGSGNPVPRYSCTAGTTNGRFIRWVMPLICFVAMFPCLGAAAGQPGESREFYAVQVSAYRHRQQAVSEVRALKEQGFEAFYRRTPIKGKGIWYRIYLGRYPSKSKAEAGAAAIKDRNEMSWYAIRKIQTTRHDPPDRPVPSSALEAKAALKGVTFQKHASERRETVSLHYSGRVLPWLTVRLDGDTPQILATLPMTATAAGKPVSITADGEWIRTITGHYDPVRHQTDVRATLAPEHVYRAFQEHDMAGGRFDFGVSIFKTHPKDSAGAARQVRSRLMSWLDAWQSKRLDAYISHYHPAFRSKGHDRESWRRYKAGLNGKYRTIHVALTDIRISVEDNRAVAAFTQHYRSDAYQDITDKELVFHRDDGVWKIYRERRRAGKEG